MEAGKPAECVPGAGAGETQRSFRSELRLGWGVGGEPPAAQDEAEGELLRSSLFSWAAPSATRAAAQPAWPRACAHCMGVHPQSSCRVSAYRVSTGGTALQAQTGSARLNRLVGSAHENDHKRVFKH